MRFASTLVTAALLLGQVSPALAAFSKDLKVTAVDFSSDFDKTMIFLSREPGETVYVRYDLFVGESRFPSSSGGTSQNAEIVTLSGFADDFESHGGQGTQFRLEFSACPQYSKNFAQDCSEPYKTYVTYARPGSMTAPRVTQASLNADRTMMTVNLDLSVDRSYIVYERRGSGNGYDYSSWMVNTNSKKTLTFDVGTDFKQSGTSGTQTITMQGCVGDASTALGASCTQKYTMTIDLATSGSFRDVSDSHANADAIRYVQQQGIVAGYANGTFQPDADINRAEFTKIVTLYKFGQEMIDMCAGRVQFTDVPRGEWYVNYICRAKDAHLVEGYPDGSFRPGTRINVVEAAKIIVLADVFGNPDAMLPGHTGGEWYEPYLRYLADRGAIPVSINRVEQNLTRGEMAEIIYRLRTGTVNKPTKTYQELAGNQNTTTTAQYRLLAQPSSSVNNYERNTVYRYSIAAPANAHVVIKNQSFFMDGGRWSGPQLAIHSDASFKNQIDTWASDDNWTDGETATLDGTLTVPAGQTLYLQLTVNIGTPSDMSSISVKHPLLPVVTLQIAN